MNYKTSDNADFEQSIVIIVSVCLSSSISPELHLRSLDLPNFCACYLWRWIGPPLEALRYVVYFRFYGFGFDVCLQCFDAVGWAAGRASGL